MLEPYPLRPYREDEAETRVVNVCLITAARAVEAEKDQLNTHNTQGLICKQ